MSSAALSELQVRLDDIDEIVNAHVALTGGGRGRPVARQGAAVTRAGVVLLAAATEGFVEDLFQEAARLLWPNRSPAEIKAFFENTVGRFANADAKKTEMLFFSLGIPWALDGINWQKFTNQSFRTSLDALIKTRNQIAHGERPRLQLKQLRAWRKMIDQYSCRLEAKVAAHVGTTTGQPPTW